MDFRIENRKGNQVKTTFRPWLHTCALLLGICCLLTIAVGAWVSCQSWPLPGADAAHAALMAPPELIGRIHLVLGILTGVLSIAIAIGAMKVRNAVVRNLGWTPLILTVAAAAFVSPSAMGAARASATLMHTLLAELLVASSAALAVVTSRSWIGGTALVEDTWKPSLRVLAIIVPALVLMQILLGAAYRRDMIGVIPHILNAMLVLMLNLVVGACLIRQFPNHPALQPAALGLIVVTSCQVLLGFTAFIVLLVSSTVTLPLEVVGAIHATIGALTMAAATILGVQIRSSIRASREAVAGIPVT